MASITLKKLNLINKHVGHLAVFNVLYTLATSPEKINETDFQSINYHGQILLVFFASKYRKGIAKANINNEIANKTFIKTLSDTSPKPDEISSEIATNVS